jgi:anion-transporting  ArsA/GET3 family ATPase
VGENTIGQPIKVSRGEVVGIGKFKIPRTEGFDYEIQLLSFLSIKEAENSFISTCIHLHIDGYGRTEDEADRNMMKNASFFLSQNFSKLPLEDAWDNLRDLFKSDNWSNELWTAYHEVQIQLSMQGEQMMDPAAELFPRFLQLMKLARKEEELKSWESELEKTRVGLENWESKLKNREDELENNIKMMGVYTYLMSKMRLAGCI